MIALGRRYYAESHGLRVHWDYCRVGHSDFEEHDGLACFTCGQPVVPGQNIYLSHDFASKRPVVTCTAVHALQATGRCCTPSQGREGRPEQLIEMAPACELCDADAVDLYVSDTGERYPWCETHADDVRLLAEQEPWAGRFAT